MSYRVEVIKDAPGLAALEGPWTALLQAVRVTSVFATWQWNSAWWRFFGGGGRLYILTVTDPSGQLVGLAPLMVRRVGPLRKLEFIGTGLSDAGDFVLHPDHAEAGIAAILDHLRRQHRHWDLLDLDEVPPDSPLARGVQAGTPPGFRLLALARTDCPVITLPPRWEEYIRGLPRKARQQVEGQARRFMDETAGARFQMVTAEGEVAAAVARFYQLHLARWAVKSEQLSPEHQEATFAPFLAEACRRCAAQGWLRLAELWVGEQVIASWISFAVNGRWSGYLTGFDPAWSQKRPGKVLHRFVMQQALGEGARELDFGRGAEAYKYELGAVNRQSRRLVLAPPALRGRLALLLLTLRRRYKRAAAKAEAGAEPD